MMFLTWPIWMLSREGSASYDIKMRVVVTIVDDAAQVTPFLNVTDMRHGVQDMINKHVSRDPAWSTWGLRNKFVMKGDPWSLQDVFHDGLPRWLDRRWNTRLSDKGALIKEVQHSLVTSMHLVMSVLSSAPHEAQVAVGFQHGMSPVWRKKQSMSSMLWDSSCIREQAVDLLGALVKVREIRCSWDVRTP